MKSLAHLILALFLFAALSACAVHQNENALTETAANTPPLSSNQFNLTDDQWQSAAEAAMTDREGALIVIDPQSGRLRAVVNPRIAFSQAYPPGSTIKPFTVL